MAKEPDPAAAARESVAIEAGEEEPVLTSAERWHRAVDTIRQRLPRLGTSLAFGRLVALRPGEVVLSFPSNAAFHRASVSGSGQTSLEGALSERLGAPTRIIIAETAEADANASPSVVEKEASLREAREKTVEARIREHPAVLASLRILGGQIERIEVLQSPLPLAEGPGEGN